MMINRPGFIVAYILPLDINYGNGNGREWEYQQSFPPIASLLCTLPRRVEAQVVWSKVEFDSTKPGPSESTSWALPVRRKTIDGRSKATLMIYVRGQLVYFVDDACDNAKSQ